eukprot:TRINITY_DN6556_c0_g1_i1.p1 TRINITY_DN6556_c0_g1~~TRINITY_DN6556_c0_g1_i1.p1  ORF type:complete len:460 (-),score=66.42 TRINITY_DN6556_c0_g1_i1:108-1487(-)
MSKVNKELIKILVFKPLDVKVVKECPFEGSIIKLFPLQAINVFYYKYSVFGMNIILFNMLPLVIFSIAEEYLFPAEYKLPPSIMFVFDIIAIVPMSYYIKMSISSLSAQSNYLVGAILNATFGNSMKIILFISAVIESQGKLNELVRYSYIGSLLGDLLLLPGLAMTIGGIKHKVQKINNEGAGVSSVLLMIALSGAFVPTMTYMIFGNYQVDCGNCTELLNGRIVCGSCTNIPIDPIQDDIYLQYIKPLSIFVSCILPLSYVVGLIFTLFTHSHIYDEFEEENEEINLPIWKKWVALTILVVATGLFTLIVKNLVNEIELLVSDTSLSQDFFGLTVISIVPSIGQYFNGVLFALNDNVSLSFETGEAAAIQTALISMPFVILVTSFLDTGIELALVFPSMCMFAVFLAVIILSIISIDGKSNYFLGFSLVVIYVILVAAFFYVPKLPLTRSNYLKVDL